MDEISFWRGMFRVLQMSIEDSGNTRKIYDEHGFSSLYRKIIQWRIETKLVLETVEGTYWTRRGECHRAGNGALGLETPNLGRCANEPQSTA